MALDRSLLLLTTPFVFVLLEAPRALLVDHVHVLDELVLQLATQSISIPPTERLVEDLQEASKEANEMVFMLRALEGPLISLDID